MSILPLHLALKLDKALDKALDLGQDLDHVLMGVIPLGKSLILGLQKKIPQTWRMIYRAKLKHNGPPEANRPPQEGPRISPCFSR